MTYKRYAAVTLVAFVLVLTQCRTPEPTVSPLTPVTSPLTSPPESPSADRALTTPEPPAPDKATIYGRVIDKESNEPLSNVSVRLAEVYREGDSGAFALDDAFSPADLTDEHGWFALENVEPMEYVIVIGDVNVAYEIIAEPSGAARVWELVADEVIDAGVFRVDLE